jgi:hypothetical protein
MHSSPRLCLSVFFIVQRNKYTEVEMLTEMQVYLNTSLMFVLCIIRRSRNNQHYALICTTPLFYILAPTCFGSSLPSSGSFLDPSGLFAIQIESVVYHIMWSVCWSVVVPSVVLPSTQTT